MKLYTNEKLPDNEGLQVGDLLVSTRGIYSVVLAVGETVVVTTDRGKTYGMSFIQAMTNRRLANEYISDFALGFVTNQCFVESVVMDYNKQKAEQTFLAQLETIPTHVLETALAGRFDRADVTAKANS